MLNGETMRRGSPLVFGTLGSLRRQIHFCRAHPFALQTQEVSDVSGDAHFHFYDSVAAVGNTSPKSAAIMPPLYFLRIEPSPINALGAPIIMSIASASGTHPKRKGSTKKAKHVASPHL